ncbi:MAG TPA: arginine--tRNA ligase, partial [Candidatus Paceibacterota bacterium]|nr:arginine--tRNA ligase [Candidatus Paceibacterota bacterium]
MKERLEKAIKEALGELGLPSVDFSLEHPKELSHGDYMTNVALIVGKQESQNPIELAEKIVENFNNQKIEGIEKVGVAGPGFINFTLKREAFAKALSDAQDKEWGNTEVYAGKKILVEHSSPNLFKPFHIGHLMNNTIGEALYRLAKRSGAEKATPISFPSDISLGIAKAIYVLREDFGKDFFPSDISVLGDAYVRGTKAYEDDKYGEETGIHPVIRDIANKLYSKDPSGEYLDIYEKCKDFNIKYFEKVVETLGSKFEGYIFESEAGEKGKTIVIDNLEIFQKSTGAIIYVPEESKKLHTAVFINSDGNPTYEAKDIGLLYLKFKNYNNPDISITVTDNQQTSHFDVVIDAAGKINPLWQKNSIHRSHGRMTFKGAKMSSRLGGVPLAEEMINAVVEEVKEKNKDISEQSAREIAVSAIKFTILKAKAGSNINFDPETSLSFEGDSGPYLQYTAVRAGALIEKGKALNISPSPESPVVGTETLERLVARFLEVVERAQREWAPHYIVTYLLELAQEFNSWYGQGKIVDEGDVSGTAYRLYVASSVRQSLINGLWVLGIETP